MTSSTEQFQIKIHTNQQKEGGANVSIQTLSNRDRWKATLKLLGILWGLALASLFVPLAHWVLVPGFLLAGPIAAFFTFRTERHLLAGTLSCPLCEEAIGYKRQSAHWPVGMTCPKCRNLLELHKE